MTDCILKVLSATHVHHVLMHSAYPRSTSKLIESLQQPVEFGLVFGAANATASKPFTSSSVRLHSPCEEVGVVKRVHLLSGEVRRVATALKVVEEVQEEVQEVKDEREDEEVEGNGGLKVEGEPHTSCVDEMTCATPLSHAMQCVNHDDKNLTNKQENCTHVSVFMCAVLKVFWVLVVTLSLVSCSVSPRRRNTKYRFFSFRIL